MSMTDTHALESMLTEEETSKSSGLPEMQVMLTIISWVSWVNLLIGLPSAFLVLSMHSMGLCFTGLLSIGTFFLLRMIVRHMSATKSWTEFGVVAMCGIYFPTLVLWWCSTSLIDAILQ